MRAANDQASLHIHIVSPEPLLIALKRRDVVEGSGQIVYNSSCDLGTYRICEEQIIRRACNLQSLARAFADCTIKMDVDEGSGQIVYTSSCDLGTYRICEQQMTRRACTFCTVSSEPSLFVLKRRDVNEG